MKGRNVGILVAVIVVVIAIAVMLYERMRNKYHHRLPPQGKDIVIRRVLPASSAPQYLQRNSKEGWVLSAASGILPSPDGFWLQWEPVASPSEKTATGVFAVPAGSNASPDAPIAAQGYLYALASNGNKEYLTPAGLGSKTNALLSLINARDSDGFVVRFESGGMIMGGVDSRSVFVFSKTPPATAAAVEFVTKDAYTKATASATTTS
jgi:hypothetical protein